MLVRFGKPSPDCRAFRCEFQIAGLLHQPIAGDRCGEDSIQALELAMQSATHQLLTSRAYQRGQLTFRGSHDSAMPLPKGMGFLDPVGSRGAAGREGGPGG